MASIFYCGEPLRKLVLPYVGMCREADEGRQTWSFTKLPTRSSTDFPRKTIADQCVFPVVAIVLLWRNERSAVRKAIRVASTPVMTTSDTDWETQMADAANDPAQMPSR